MRVLFSIKGVRLGVHVLPNRYHEHIPIRHSRHSALFSMRGRVDRGCAAKAHTENTRAHM